MFGAPEIDDTQKNELGLSFETNGRDSDIYEYKDEDGNIQQAIQTIGAFTALLRTFRNVLIMVKDAWGEVFHWEATDLYFVILKFKEFANSKNPWEEIDLDTYEKHITFFQSFRKP